MAALVDQLPPDAPRPGEMFAGKYRVEHVLGVGGMGYVLAATHIHLEELVAIKVLLPELMRDQEMVHRFLREGRAAGRIQSEHVARVKDVGELQDRTPYIVMEYLEGLDLGALIEREHAVPCAQAVDYVLQACEAIAEAHAMKTVHRDLKPANIFLASMPDGTSCIKVLDFGISKMGTGDATSVQITSTLAVMGSPAYMSPEQLKSSRAVDSRADIWSLGVILFELVSGRLPFDARNIAELSVQVLSDEPPWLADVMPAVPRELASVVATCLRKKTDERFSDLAELAEALAPFGSASAATSRDRIMKTLGPPTKPVARVLAPPTRPARGLELASTEPSMPEVDRAMSVTATAPMVARKPARGAVRGSLAMLLVLTAVATFGVAFSKLRRAPSAATFVAGSAPPPAASPPARVKEEENAVTREPQVPPPIVSVSVSVSASASASAAPSSSGRAPRASGGRAPAHGTTVPTATGARRTPPPVPVVSSPGPPPTSLGGAATSPKE